MEWVVSVQIYQYLPSKINNMSGDAAADLPATYRRYLQIRQSYPNNTNIHSPQKPLSTGENNNQERIQVYLRSPSKKSFKMQTTPKISLCDIKSMAEQNLKISKEKQLLYLNGKDITNYAHIQLQPLSIIHITSKDNLLKAQESFTVKIIIIDSFAQNSVVEKFCTLRASQAVNDLAKRIHDEKGEGFEVAGENPYYYFLESGRLLERERSFYQQNVAHNTELICLITKHELKTRFVNDTREDIAHDIQQLFGFDTKKRQQLPRKQQGGTENPQQHNKKAISEKLLFEEARLANRQQKQQAESNSSQVYQQEQIYNSERKDPIANFKKKTNMESNRIINQNQRSLANKIKASKTKRQLEQMLKLQGKDNIFCCSEIIMEKKIDGEGSNKKISQEEVTLHKPTASIPKVMPVEQRRKIKQEMQKLFDFGGIEESPSLTPEKKEEEQPKSPPTELPPRLEKKKEKMENLRFSLGSRPAFLNNLKLPNKNESK